MSRSLALLAISAIVATPASATPPNRAAEVFERVCVDGGGGFGAGEISPVDAARIPLRARSAMMFGLWTHQYSPNGHRAVEPDEMPAGTFHISGEDEIYLVVPDQTPTNPVQVACSVVIKGDHYEEMASYAAALTQNSLPDLRLANLKASFQFGSFGVAVAKAPGTGQAWTLIASAPLQ